MYVYYERKYPIRAWFVNLPLLAYAFTHVYMYAGLPTVPRLMETAQRLLAVAGRRIHYGDGEFSDGMGAARGDGAWPPAVRAALQVGGGGVGLLIVPTQTPQFLSHASLHPFINFLPF